VKPWTVSVVLLLALLLALVVLGLDGDLLDLAGVNDGLALGHGCLLPSV